VAVVQPAPPVDGIFDTHTQVFRGVETRIQHRDWQKDIFEIAPIYLTGASFAENLK
jgi:hypothetical protein